MTSKEIYQSIDQSKLSPKGREFLKSVEKNTKGFTRQYDKVDSVLKKLYSDLKAKKPEALKDVKTITVEKEVKVPTTKTEQKKEPKKKTKTVKKKVKKATGKKKVTKPTKTPSTPKEGKVEHISTRAKKLADKEGISFKEARARLSKEAKEQLKKDEKQADKELDKLLKFVRKDAFEDGEKYPKIYGKQDPKKSSLSNDAKRKAKPVGKRVSKNGKTYYEYRDNRSDRNSLPTKEGYKYKGEAPPYLEAGGTLPTPFGQAGLVGETGAMNEADLFAMGGGLPQGVHQYYANTYNPAYPTPHGYAKGGKIEVGKKYSATLSNKFKKRVPTKFEVISKFKGRDNMPMVEILTEDGRRANVFETDLKPLMFAKGGEIVVKGIDKDGGEFYREFDSYEDALEEISQPQFNHLDRDSIRYYDEDGKLVMAKGGEVEPKKDSPFSVEVWKSKARYNSNKPSLDKEVKTYNEALELSLSSIDDGAYKSQIMSKEGYLWEVDKDGVQSYAKGGKMKQGYNDRLDESLGNRDGVEPLMMQSYKDRRDESKGMEKAMGRRAYQSVGTMDDVGNPTDPNVIKEMEIYIKKEIPKLDKERFFTEGMKRKEAKRRFYKKFGYGAYNPRFSLFAKGGKTQGYNDRLDESLGNRNSVEPLMMQSYKDRRDESKGMEKAMGRRAYQSVGTMDRMAKGGEIDAFIMKFVKDAPASNLRVDAEELTAKLKKGGKLGFDGLAKKVAKRYEGKPVEKQFQNEYGKRYSKEEAMEVGRKVAGKVYRQQQGMEKGGEIDGRYLVSLDGRNDLWRGNNYDEAYDEFINERSKYLYKMDVILIDTLNDETLDYYDAQEDREQDDMFAKGGKTKRSKHSLMQDRRRVSKEPWEVAYQKRKSKMEAGGTLPTPFGQAGLVGETGAMNEMDMFAMGGGLPQGVHQYYANTYNPAYPTPHGYAKGGEVKFKTFANSLPSTEDAENIKVFNTNSETFGFINDDLSSGIPSRVFVSNSKNSDSGKYADVDDLIVVKDKMAHGGMHSQGYNDRLDESLGNRDGVEPLMMQSYKDRRDESKGMEKAMGRRAYQSVGTMDRMANGGEINKRFLDNQTSSYRDRIFQSIADYYGTTKSKIQRELFDKDAEMIYEYIGNNRGLKMRVYEDMQKQSFAKGGEVDYEVYNLKDRLIDLGDDDFVNWAEKNNQNPSLLKYEFIDRLTDYHGEEYAKGGKLEAEWLVVLKDDDGFELDEVVFAKNEDEAMVKAEKLNPNNEGVLSVMMLTDYDGKKIQFAKGGRLKVYDESYDEPIKTFNSFEKAKKWVLANHKKFDEITIEDAYLDTIVVDKTDTKDDIEFLFSDNMAKGGRLGTKILKSKKFKTKEEAEKSMNNLKNLSMYDKDGKKIILRGIRIEKEQDGYIATASYLKRDYKLAKGGNTDEYVAITLKPKKSAYKGGKGEIYNNMQTFYDTINAKENEDKYDFIHSLFISDSRKSDPQDISEIKVYMIGEKSGFDDVEKRGLYDLFDLVKTKEEVKDYAKGGKTQGYNDKLDESLGNTKGKRSKKEQNYKDRRNESEAMEKKGGKRKYARVKTMDKGNRSKRKTPMSLAKEIRKEGEKWQDAVKRASAMLKKK